MKHVFIAGNWKSNKTLGEANAWIDQFHFKPTDTTVVLCVPFTLLSELHKQSLPFALGAQNVSAFAEGAYTGEVSARQVKELADWVIIGHSERRKFFGETDTVLEQKVKQSLAVGLRVIYCVGDKHATVPDGVRVIAYEPIWAIGTGKTDTPENANAVIGEIKKNTGVKTCIYGGSVTAENVKSFVDMDAIDGVLPGGASLDAEKFMKLIQSASDAI